MRSPGAGNNAAEIGLEYNLGLTCAPGDLMELPYIERNAMGAPMAVNVAHFLSPDKAVKTMRDIGVYMKTRYKETARGGLAVNSIKY